MVTKVISAASRHAPDAGYGVGQEHRRQQLQHADDQMGIGGKAPTAVAGAQESGASQMDSGAEAEQAGQ